MALNKEEQEFIDSIKNKIKYNEIPITPREALAQASGTFMLTIYNDNSTELVDTGVEITLIRKSFTYFLEKYCRVIIPGLGVVAMKPYYFQAEMAKEIENYRKIVVDKTRQCGLSTIFSLYTLWKANFFSAENIDVISLKQMKAQQFIEKMKPTLKKLPEWMKTPVVVNNQKQISFKHSDGSISNIISEPQSENAGRSDSLSLLVMDELAFYASDNMVRGIISAATPTLSKTGGRVIMISTPNGTTGAGSYYYGQVQEAKQELHEDTKYIEIDWWEVPDDDRISGPKKGYNKVLKEAIGRGYYYNKLIKEDYKKFFTEIVKNYTKNSWLKSTYNDLGDIKFRQEILHEFVIEGDRVFGPDVMKRVYDRLKDPIIKDELWVDGKFLREQRGFWIWEHAKPGAKYILGVDVSSGTSSDTSTIEVLDTTTMEQVAEFKGFISTPMFARLVKDIARIYNDAFVVIECNSIGDTIFSNVYYSENDPYGNVYKQKKTKNGITRFTGWITDVSTRKLMVKEFIDWVAVPELFEQFKINSSRLYNEMETWIWVGVDKAMHANNCHDDAIMAMALALKLRDKAQLQESSMFIAEDGTVITYDREATMERAREEVVSFSSVDGSGKKKVNIKGGNSAGIMSSNSDEFGGTALERKIKKEYNVSSIDELRWLLGG